MSIVNAVRILAGALIPIASLMIPASAQTSIGFEKPGDTTNLLEYRLPDWGYRIWDLGFGLDGNGSDAYRGDLNQQFRNHFSTHLDSRFDLYRESEPRIYSFSAEVGGRYNRSHSGNSEQEQSGHSLEAVLGIGGDWKEYLGGGPFSLRAIASVRPRYMEAVQEVRGIQGLDENRWYRRQILSSYGLGVGWGRVRDVTPLIRAERLSERLAALGRPRLRRDQVQEIARVLATEHGYRMVFDRPDRSFWRDVLQPMLDPDHPLSPYEIFYLRDVMDENVGPRSEGIELQGQFFYFDDHGSGGTSEYRHIRRGPEVYFRWVKNLSLNHQLALNSSAIHTRSGQNANRGDQLNWFAGLSYLWTIADRYRWDTGLGVHGYYTEFERDDTRQIDRTVVSRLDSTFRVYLENSLALNLSARGSNRQVNAESNRTVNEEFYNREWTWFYSIGLEYYLDRILY